MAQMRSDTVSPVRCACSSSSWNRRPSAVRLSRPVRGSSTDSLRCSTSAPLSAPTTAVMLTRRATDTTSGAGCARVPLGSTATVAPSSIITALPTAATTTWVRNLVAAKDVGTTSHGNAGLAGPPLRATATASSSWLQTMLAATCRSGRALRSIRRSTVCVFSAESAKSANVHQPNIGANRRRVSPTEADAIVRARETRAPTSITRARSISVRQSHVLAGTSMRASSARALDGLRKAASRALFAEQAELERLTEGVAPRPVLDHLGVLHPPDVDLLGGELLARRGPTEELAEMAAMHGHAGDDLLALRDLVFDVSPHRTPQPAQPANGLLEPLRPLRVVRRRLVVHEVGMDQLVGHLEVSLLEQLLEHAPGDPLVLL